MNISFLSQVSRAYSVGIHLCGIYNLIHRCCSDVRHLNIPKKPLNRFMRFSYSIYPELHESYPDLKVTEIAKIIGGKYRILSKEEFQGLSDSFQLDAFIYAKARDDFYAQLSDEEKSVLLTHVKQKLEKKKLLRIKREARKIKYCVRVVCNIVTQRPELTIQSLDAFMHIYDGGDFYTQLSDEEKATVLKRVKLRLKKKKVQSVYKEARQKKLSSSAERIALNMPSKGCNQNALEYFYNKKRGTLSDDVTPRQAKAVLIAQFKALPREERLEYRRVARRGRKLYHEEMQQWVKLMRQQGREDLIPPRWKSQHAHPIEFTVDANNSVDLDNVVASLPLSMSSSFPPDDDDFGDTDITPPYLMSYYSEHAGLSVDDDNDSDFGYLDISSPHFMSPHTGQSNVLATHAGDDDLDHFETTQSILMSSCEKHFNHSIEEENDDDLDDVDGIFGCSTSFHRIQPEPSVNGLKRSINSEDIPQNLTPYHIDQLGASLDGGDALDELDVLPSHLRYITLNSENTDALNHLKLKSPCSSNNYCENYPDAQFYKDPDDGKDCE